ncbi:MAG: NAD(P)/FAD-dependent oxidoreductase [Frankiales bacterium]|nr:NAD(P)/FAD-dependent oxidoreductase [Frankiales bacterium]
MTMPTVSRRSVLISGATGLVAAAVPALASTPRARTEQRPDRRTPKRVVVIGAGLAGMTTALDLRDKGWDVVVLEARDRVGGRVHTLYDPFTTGLHAESGGESIDDGHYAIQAMLKRFGLRTEERPPTKPYDSAVYYKSMREPLAAFLSRSNGKTLSDYLRCQDAMAALGDGIDPQHPERARNAERLDAMSFETFVRSLHLAPEAEFLVRLQNRGEYNAELRDISCLFVAQQSVAAPPSLDGQGLTGTETMRISGGNSTLPVAMAKALGSRIRLNSPVLRVEHSRHGVRVHTPHGHVDAAWCVIAAPLMPMRRVHFSPTLPASVARVIDDLDLGHAAKVIHEYAVPFWKAEGSSGFTVTDLPFAIAWSSTDSRVDTVPGLLTQFITGDAAMTAARLPAPKRIAHFGAQLDRVYPEGKPLQASNTATMAWANERYTGGGYAVFKPGQMAPFWPVLRHGFGRIRFAGEHTETLAGYMESAVRSGHRIARELGRAPR